MIGGDGDADPAAHAVRDDDRRRGQARVVRDRDHFTRPCVHVVVIAAVAVAVAGQVERHDAVLAGEQRRDVIPPAGVRGATVHEHQAGPIGRSPTAIVDAHAVDVDIAVLGTWSRARPGTTAARIAAVSVTARLRALPSHLRIVSTYSSMMSNTTSFAGRTRSTRPMICPTGEPDSAFDCERA